ncbi:Disease resistance protein [Actinidia chinensis var. chinensis]|uniref:Disease resistance protein n=1 Tax=Actinidia chinensis var. chinensis TaxID=1590841 RepID=A0A2R6QQ37_ACTCC|nr:Disease resistance protein [Actinidia chinensis var. chinensis]
MSHAENDWLEKLRDILHDADDLVDDFTAEALQKRMVTPQINFVEKVFHLFSTIGFYIDMAYRLKDVRDRLDDMAADRSKFHPLGQGVDLLVRNKEREQTYSYVFEPNIVGRDDDKKEIKKMIMETRNEVNVSVIPMTGIGGIGKTTLAQLVYNDAEVKRYFQLKMCVCVSNGFDMDAIVRKMIESATHRKCENFELEVLQTLLRKEIEGKRYLLVLDDMWSDNRERWEKFRELLQGGGRGSTIIVTTRMEVVATITGTVGSTYELKRLPEDLSWSLFRQVAFKVGQEDPRLVTIGKEIVRKCVGNPLAIRASGSLLYSKDTEYEWLSFKLCKFPGMPRNEDFDVLEILKFSYDHLPSHLKPCFAYCSLYSKDYTMDKDTLIKLWMAQGFIQSSDGNQCLEDVGDECFMQLRRRSFFQDVKEEYLGKTLCTMNDLFHDLAKSVAGTEISIADLDPGNVVKRSRHISFSSPLDSSWEIPTCLLNASKLRTFLLPVQPKASPRYLMSFSTCELIFLRFPRLRVLDLHNLWLHTLPISVGELRYLKYLDLRYNKRLVHLPSSITKLRNLQTLRLSYCEYLQELPTDICKLVSLRHLEIDGCITLTHMPLGVGQLTCLQTLTQFIVGRENISCSGLTELNSLANLRGRLAVQGLGRLKRAAIEAAGCLKRETIPSAVGFKLGIPY